MTKAAREHEIQLNSLDKLVLHFSPLSWAPKPKYHEVLGDVLSLTDEGW